MRNNASFGTGILYRGLLSILFCSSVMAAETDSNWSSAKETPEQHAARLQWWNTARFGMFIHWGIYSVTGGEYGEKPITNSAEWMMNKGKIPIAEYSKFADQFNPTQFDAEPSVLQAIAAEHRVAAGQQGLPPTPSADLDRAQVRCRAPH